MSKRGVLFVGLICLLAAPAVASAQESGGGRYDLERYYVGDISASKAYLVTQRGYTGSDREQFRGAVLIDVRTIEEHVAGHPFRSYNIPYPRISGRTILQDPKTFFDAVAAKFPDRTKPILTLCKTGHRSVLAANILANPGKYIEGYEDVEGYVNVYNIWEGFEGRTKVNQNLDGPLDLNNDGVIDAADKDGWANWAGLPVSTKLFSWALYEPYKELYFQ